MTLSNEHIDFEKQCSRIIGFTIEKVEYLEILYEEESSEPYYPTQFQNLHSVDFSILLHTDTKDTVDIYWDGMFFQYGIGIKVNEPSDFTVYIKRDVTQTDLWKKFIGSKIIDLKITWDTVTTTYSKIGKTETFIYPQDIKISFSNNQSVFVSAAGFLNEGDIHVFGMLDNLMVTDNEELARQVKMID